MNKQILLSFLFFLSQLLYCQDKKSGSVIYVASLDISILVNYAIKTPNKFNKQINQTINNIKDVNYLLIFNNKHSNFTIERKLENENKKRTMNLTKVKAGSGQYFYDKVNSETLHQKNSFGEQFLITVPSTKWQITNENKTIGKYLCYKATTTKTIESRRGKNIIEVEAWYTPEIPFNYGPKNYSGLPGLIIKLKEGDLAFYAKKIIIKKDTIEIKKPQNGRKISLDEYNKMVKNLVSNKKRN